MNRVTMNVLTKTDIAPLVSSTLRSRLSDEEGQNVARCAECTTTVWAGYIDGDLVCILGLIPPTLLSNVAYLWLHTTEAVKDHEFIFVRRSQRAIEELLKMYPTIVGHCEAKATRSIRWLKWLGAKFGELEGKFVPFIIKA